MSEMRMHGDWMQICSSPEGYSRACESASMSCTESVLGYRDRYARSAWPRSNLGGLCVGHCMCHRIQGDGMCAEGHVSGRNKDGASSSGRT